MIILTPQKIIHPVKKQEIQTPNERKAFSVRQKSFQAAWKNQLFEVPENHMKRPICMRFENELRMYVV